MPLRLLDGPESPQEHVRNALGLLDDVERAFRALGFVLTADQLIDIYTPLVAARGRLWRAVTILEGSPDEEQHG